MCVGDQLMCDTVWCGVRYWWFVVCTWCGVLDVNHEHWLADDGLQCCCVWLVVCGMWCVVCVLMIMQCVYVLVCIFMCCIVHVCMT